MRGNAWTIGGLVAFLALAAAVLWYFSQTPEVENDRQQGARIESVATMDALFRSLEARAREKLGQTEDFQIFVTEGAYPVGVVLRAGRTVPINRTACLQEPAPPGVPNPSLFANYLLQSEAAAALGLSETIRSAVGDVGVSGQRSNSIELVFRNVATTTLSDDEIASLVDQEACRNVLRREGALLVRGYISARREFTLRRANRAELAVTPNNIGHFRVTPNQTENTISIVDDAPQQFLQIVSQIAVPDDPDSTVQPRILSRLIEPSGRGRVYIQRDEADGTRLAEEVRTALREAEFGVVSTIEAIASANMPGAPQVRYFNDEDAAFANDAVERLAPLYPDIVAVRIRLPAPAEQLEVWLPRSDSPSQALALSRRERGRRRATGSTAAITRAEARRAVSDRELPR